MTQELERAAASKNDEDKTVIANYELLGSKEIYYEGELVVPRGVSLFIPEDIIYLNSGLDDCFGVFGTLVCSPYKLFEKATNYGNSFVHVFRDSHLIIDDIEVYGGEGNFWASVFLTRRNDWNPNVFYLEVFNNTYVYSKAQEFADAGYEYCFGYGSDKISIYFDDSDEAYDSFVPGATEILQLEIEQMIGTGGEIVVDYPVIVGKNKELWIHAPVTVILKEGGVITLEEGANLFVQGTIIEDGGMIENPARITMVDDGEVRK